MAVPSIALAYRRSALMSATKVTTKPPSEEILRARDDFKDFCVCYGKSSSTAHAGMAQTIMYRRR